MGATSITGTGRGDSGGKHKPNNQCGGCGCGSTEEESATPKVKRGCVTSIRVGGTAVLRVGGGASAKVC